VATAGFSAFQWFESQRQSRINAAIEFSKMYLQDSDLSRRYTMFVDFDPKTNRSISGRIKCDIGYVNKVVAERRPDLSNAIKEINRYVKDRRDADCQDYPPQSN
jgi:hypothetical protein